MMIQSDSYFLEWDKTTNQYKYGYIKHEYIHMVMENIKQLSYITSMAPPCTILIWLVIASNASKLNMINIVLSIYTLICMVFH